MKKLKVKMLKDECWWGGDVIESKNMPFTEKSDVYVRIISYKGCQNQTSALLLSNKGRVIYGGEFDAQIKKGVITVIYDEKTGKPEVFNGGSTLKDAYSFACKDIIAPDGVVPPVEFFKGIQYNDWMELLFDQTQENVLKYAHDIEANGYPCSLLMIDDKWMEYYGRFEFCQSRFPDPKKMLDELHKMGFKVMLWEAPFVTPDMVEWKRLNAKGYLIKDKKKLSYGWPKIVEWWNGYSAAFDLTNEDAVNWLHEQNQKLMDLGVDGFKFDAGDIVYYSKEDVTKHPVTPAEHCKLWSEFGAKYKYNEFRASYNMGGKCALMRQHDKDHSWGQTGMASLIPSLLCQSMLGYNYSCPDMVGGGHIGGCDNISEELFVRYAACAALMPMMQFSISPWRVLSKEGNALCLKFAKLHVEFGDYIYSLVEKCAKTGEPICRPLDYQFPNEGFEKEIGSFMLGDKYLVSPVMTEGAVNKTIKLPLGQWKYVDGKIFEGGKEYTVDTPLDILPYFERV